MMNRFLAPLILLLLGSIFAVVGGVMVVVIGGPMLKSAELSQKWPTTAGTIIESELDQYQDDEHGRMYKAIVVYTYSLDGSDFESDRIQFGGDFSTSDRSTIRELLKAYPQGQAVEVYYNPAQPSESVLEPGTSLGGNIVYGIGIVFLSIGGLLLLILIVVIYRMLVAPTDEDQRSNDGAANSEGSSDNEYAYRDPLAEDRSY